MTPFRSITPASPPWRSRWHVLLAVPLALMMILSAPYLAIAAFTAVTSATLGVSTYNIPAPASMTTGTHTCTTTKGVKGASITVSSWSSVLRATGYVVRLTSPNGQQSQIVVNGGNSSSVTISVQNTGGGGTGPYTLSVRASIGSWIGAPLNKPLTC